MLGVAYTNTEYERLALSNPLNLSDGHARQDLTPAQAEIIESAPGMYRDARTRPLVNIEQEFIDYFFDCAAQNPFPARRRVFLSYSASSAISLVSQACRLRGLDVILIEPCFDNIRHLLMTAGVGVVACSEEMLGDPSAMRDVLGPGKALWIVQPNNPTGHCLVEEQFRRLVDVVVAAKSTLIVDFSFRFFGRDLYRWQQYRAFDAAGLDYVCIEDTGKTWPVADMKAGLTVASPTWADLIHRLHDQLLLSVSPWTLLILSQFMCDALRRGVPNAVRAEIDRNRGVVLDLVRERLVTRAGRWSDNAPLEFLTLPAGASALAFWDGLRRVGVDVLPGHNYYWSDATKGRSQFRVPLARPRVEIDQAVPRLRAALQALA